MILLLLSVKDATDSSKGGWKFTFQSTRPNQRESNMGKMRRLLAAVLVASMLFGTNGVSYAAETIADGASQETTVEETTEAATEDTESAAPAESDPSETVDAVTQTGAEDSSQDDSEAAEEVADTESDADDKAAAADNETDASETDKANDAAVSETGDAGNDAETPEAGSSTEVAEEVPAEVTFSAGKLEFNGDDYGKDYSVTLTYDADAEIPADAGSTASCSSCSEPDVFSSAAAVSVTSSCFSGSVTSSVAASVVSSTVVS